jgi:hypothetical protein
MPWDLPSFVGGAVAGLLPFVADKIWNLATAKKLGFKALGVMYHDLSGVVVILTVRNPGSQADTVTGHGVVYIAEVGNRVLDDLPESFDAGNARRITATPIRIEAGETLLGALYFPDSSGMVAKRLEESPLLSAELRLNTTQRGEKQHAVQFDIVRA